jgi:hypothetical protein
VTSTPKGQGDIIASCTFLRIRALLASFSLDRT